MTTVRKDAPWCPSNLEFIRRINDLDSIDAVKRIVFDASYLVMGLGDVYLGAPVATPLDPRHRLVTTKYNPARTWTAENSVGIGGAYLCVYGMEGPGGYQFVGRTLQMWNRYRATADFAGRPYLLRFFDQIRFYEVSADDLLRIRADFPLGRYPLRIEETELSLADYRGVSRTRGGGYRRLPHAPASRVSGRARTLARSGRGRAKLRAARRRGAGSRAARRRANRRRQRNRGQPVAGAREDRRARCGRRRAFHHRIDEDGDIRLRAVRGRRERHPCRTGNARESGTARCSDRSHFKENRPMPSFDLRLSTLRAAYRAKDTTPAKLIGELRAKAAALNPEFNLFIHLLTDTEIAPYLDALDAVDARDIDSLPLYGIPFAIKDNIDLAGIPMKKDGVHPRHHRRLGCATAAYID